LVNDKNIKNNDDIRSVPQNKCYLCGSVGKEIYSNLFDRLYGAKGYWNFYKCTNSDCKFIWLNPMPIEEDIWKAYKTYYTHTSLNSGLLPFMRPLEKGYLNIKFGYYSDSITLFQKLLGSILFLFPTEKAEVDFSIMYLHSQVGGNLLDIGCGNGWFIKNMQSLKWDVTGIDFDPEAIKYCKSQGLNVSLGSLHSQKYPDTFFNVITINHVIEHIHDPLSLLKECYRILKKGGILIIETPNTNSWLHKYIYKEYWLNLDPPRHLLLFNPQNLKKLVNNAGFNSIKATSVIRNEFWIYIVSRLIKKYKYYTMEGKKKPIIQHIIGRLIQFFSWIINIFNKNLGGDAVVIAKKS
jgi:2-polyprenyl-3-methyl-5-hydroxy-6-metoxy-1,4-benzoquinol methylase